MPPISPVGPGLSDYSTLKFSRQPASQAINATPIFEEDSEWWVSLQQCGATFALATALAIGSLSSAQAAQVANYHQDDPAGSLHAPADEHIYQQQVTLYQDWEIPALYSFDAGEIVPQPVAFLPDEDFYQPQPTAPLDIEFFQPWTYGDQEPASSPAAAPPEEYFYQPTQTVPLDIEYFQPWSFDQPEQFTHFDDEPAFVAQSMAWAYWIAPTFTDDDLALPQQAPYDDSVCLMLITQWPDYVVTLY